MEYKFQAKGVEKHQPFDEVMPPSSPDIKSLRYTLDSAHDFAFFASKLFLVQYDTVQLPTQVVDAFTFYPPWNKTNWQNSLSYVKSAVHFYSETLGEYPYHVVSAVLGDAGKETGGMEYPTITLLEMSDSGKELDATIAHEVGHNWLYGILASNERDNGWMDEGINTYYEHRYLAQRYPVTENHSFPFTKFPANLDTLVMTTLESLHKDQPVQLTSDSFTLINYGNIVYSKTAMWLTQLADTIGVSLFDSCMKRYYQQWKFRHPQPHDFQQTLETCTGQSLEQWFAKLHTTGSLFATGKRTLKPAFLFNEKETLRYRYLSLAPAVGYNHYDGLMLGGLMHNYQFPLNRFNFLVAPLYATGNLKS